eukprot:SAG11_NODE_386_length_9887_cov_3.904986_2_plen_94_part_00
MRESFPVLDRSAQIEGRKQDNVKVQTRLRRVTDSRPGPEEVRGERSLEKIVGADFVRRAQVTRNVNHDCIWAVRLPTIPPIVLALVHVIAPGY